MTEEICHEEDMQHMERVKQVDSLAATYITHDEIVAWLKTWGSKKRKPPINSQKQS